MTILIKVSGLILSSLLPVASMVGGLEEQFLEAVRKSDVAMMKELLARGVNVNAKSRYDRTALSFACDRGNVEVVRALLGAGADVNARDSFYQADAMTWALNKKHIEIAQILLEKGARNHEEVLIAGVNSNSTGLVKESLKRGGLPAESLTVALVLADREKRTEIVKLLKGAAATPPFAADVALLEKYVGSYRAEDGQELFFSYKDGVFQGGPAGENLRLLALSKEKFRPEAFAGLAVTFASQGDRIVSVTLHEGNNETVYKRVEAAP